MEKRSLPLNFYCRSARLLLKKATFSRKSNLLAEELRHLKKFSTLAFSVIPSHPEYEDEKKRKLAEDLEDYMDDVRERIEELEEELTSTSTVVGYRKSGLSNGSNRKQLVARNDRSVVGSRKQQLWAKFVRKLYDAAPCFSGRLKRRQSLTGQLLGSRSSRGSSSRFLFNLTDVASLSSESPFSDEELQDNNHRDDNDPPDKSFKLTASKEITLDIRRKDSSRNDSISMDSESTTRTQLMQQIAEATNLSLEGKFLNLQTIVMQLRDSVEGLRSRVEEEGKRWRGRADTLERKLKVLKDETDTDLAGLKRQVEEDLKKIPAGDQEQKKKITAKQKFEELMDSSTGEVEEFRAQVNQFVTQSQKMLTLGLEERFLDSLSEMRTDLKNDVSNLEIGLSKDVDNLRQEMASRYESMLIDVEMGRIGGQQQINTLKKQRFEKDAIAAAPDAAAIKQVDAVRGDLAALRKEMERLRDDQKFEKLQLKKQLQCFKQEAMEARVDTEVWIKECEVQVKEFRHDLIELRGEQEEMKVDVEVLKRQMMDREYPRPRSVDFDDRHDPGSGSGSGSLPVEFASNLLMVEKVEKFSKLYTGCLEDLQERLNRVESVHDCISDLQARVYRLETLSTNPGEAMALIERERSLATSAATDAIAAASKTKDMLKEAFETFLSRMQDQIGVRDVVELSGDEPKQERYLKATVQRLNRQMKEVFERLTTVSCVKAPAAGKKLAAKSAAKKDLKSIGEINPANVSSIEHKIRTAAGIMSQLTDRIHKLETVQSSLSRSIDDARKGNQALKKAANFWLPRYETTAKMVVEINTRLSLIEQRKPSTEIVDPATKQQAVVDVTTKPDFGMDSFDRLLALESRVDHIASATYANLRLLDAKVEHASIGMRSALDIASETEDKCSSLGGELVKVFRLILTSRDSPSRKSESPPPLPPPAPPVPQRGPQERTKSPAKSPPPRFSSPLPGQLPGTRSPLPGQLPGIPVSKSPLPVSKSPLPVSKSPLPGTKSPPPGIKSPLPASIAPAVAAAVRSPEPKQHLYNPLPAKPVKRISLKFGDQGNITAK